jgi:hypothetical protein
MLTLRTHHFLSPTLIVCPAASVDLVVIASARAHPELLHDAGFSFWVK